MKKIIFLLFYSMPAMASFSYSRTITISHLLVPSTQSSFPVLISSGTAFSASLATVANGGRAQNSSGYDIGFYSNANCSTGKLNWETEDYSATTGVARYWVLNTSLSSSVDTVFYMCYGDPSISSFQGGSTGSVWDSNYKGIWHVPNGSSLTGNDSTSNANNLTTVTATATSGQIDGAAAFNGTTQTLSVTEPTSLKFTGSQTLSCWFYETDNSNYRGMIINGGGATRSNCIYLSVGSLQSIYYNNVGDLAISSPWTLNTWNYFVLTDNGTTINMYLNGNSVYSSNTSVGGASGAATLMALGFNSIDGSYNMSGSIDEARISNSVRSADWIRTEYNNQRSPSTFYTVGSETPLGGIAPALFSDEF